MGNNAVRDDNRVPAMMGVQSDDASILLPVKINPSTRLSKIAKFDTATVNSTHHQSVKEIGKGLKISATAEDGIIEAIESNGDGFIVGVQWHPERIYNKDSCSKNIFTEFIKEANRFKQKK